MNVLLCSRAILGMADLVAEGWQLFPWSSSIGCQLAEKPEIHGNKGLLLLHS
jgi:hypothetical protein